MRGAPPRFRGWLVAGALALASSSVAAPAEALEMEDLLGSWHVLAHYKDSGTDHPDRERWVDRVWKFEREGDRIKWTDYPIVVFDQPDGRFERLGTNRQSRILAFWEPNDAQLANIQAGLQVNKRGAKSKTLKTADEGWTSATRARPGSMNFISYVETWTVGGLPDSPVFQRSDSLSSGMTETLEGTTRYTTTAIDSSGLLLSGRFERDGTQEGTFRMMRSGGTQWVKGKGKSPNERFREMAISQYGASLGVQQDLRKEIVRAMTAAGYEFTDEQVDSLSERMTALAAQGKTRSEITRILEAEMLEEARMKFDFAPEGAVHDDTVLYRIPFESEKPRPFQLGVFGEKVTQARMAHGVNVRLPEGDPVIAARGGEVAAVVDGYTRGGNNASLADKANVVLVLHDDGSFASYTHLSSGIPVKPGDRVEAGEVLGRSGNTGYSPKPHLHFAVWVRDEDGETRTVPIRFAGPDGKGFAPTTGGYYGGPGA